MGWWSLRRARSASALTETGGDGGRLSVPVPSTVGGAIRRGTPRRAGATSFEPDGRRTCGKGESATASMVQVARRRSPRQAPLGVGGAEADFLGRHHVPAVLVGGPTDVDTVVRPAAAVRFLRRHRRQDWKDVAIMARLLAVGWAN
jgi:hypothetical protein